MSRITRFIGLTVVLAVLFDACNKETVVPAPSITSFLPASAPTGASITITGLNFSPTLAGNVVKFNNIDAPVTAATATSITATVPSGNTNGPITVTVGSQSATSSTHFTLRCNLKSIVTSTSSSSSTITYEYSTDYRLTKVTQVSGTGTVTSTFALNSVGNVTTLTSTGPSGTFVTTYTYGSNNLMISETTGTSTTTYSYNSSGQMTQATFSPTSNSILTYPNNTTRNYSRESYTSSGGVVINVDYEYDTKPNPFKNTYPWRPWEADNNTTKVIIGTSQFIYAFTYNAYGYPLTETGSSASTLMTTYTYDCN